MLLVLHVSKHAIHSAKIEIGGRRAREEQAAFSFRFRHS